MDDFTEVDSYDAVPVAIMEIWGVYDRECNGFDATHEREVERYLDGAEVEVPDDEKKQI